MGETGSLYMGKGGVGGLTWSTSSAKAAASAADRVPAAATCASVTGIALTMHAITWGRLPLLARRSSYS